MLPMDYCDFDVPSPKRTTTVLPSLSHHEVRLKVKGSRLARACTHHTLKSANIWGQPGTFAYSSRVNQ
ncbi:hypothetical protein J6590_096497 [Homalodisca vitripennis]|nr:hypothetical protein J6590_096497 [Homalodisca vitripennis]